MWVLRSLDSVWWQLCDFCSFIGWDLQRILHCALTVKEMIDIQLPHEKAKPGRALESTNQELSFDIPRDYYIFGEKIRDCIQHRKVLFTAYVGFSFPLSFPPNFVPIGVIVS